MGIYDIILGCVGICIVLATVGMLTIGVSGVIPPMLIALGAITAGLFVYAPIEKEDIPAIN